MTCTFPKSVLGNGQPGPGDGEERICTLDRILALVLLLLLLPSLPSFLPIDTTAQTQTHSLTRSLKLPLSTVAKNETLLPAASPRSPSVARQRRGPAPSDDPHSGREARQPARQRRTSSCSRNKRPRLTSTSSILTLDLDSRLLSVETGCDILAPSLDRQLQPWRRTRLPTYRAQPGNSHGEWREPGDDPGLRVSGEISVMATSSSTNITFPE